MGVAPAAPALPGILLEMQLLGPTPDLWNQRIWEVGPAICVIISPAWDSDAAKL